MIQSPTRSKAPGHAVILAAREGVWASRRERELVTPLAKQLRAALSLVMASSLAIMAGCATAPKRSPVTAELGRREITTAQIEYQLFDFVTRFSRQVEQAADQIASHSSNPTVRRNALLWKLYAIPAVQLATEHSDPLATLVDLWAFCVQQTTYFESGAGNDLFGKDQGVAIQTSRKLESEIAGIAAILMKSDALDLAHKEIVQWAAMHPLENHLFARSSIVTLVADVYPDRPVGFFESLNTVQAELANFKGRVALYADTLPRQARWQAELLIEQHGGPLVGAQLTNAFRLVALEREAIVSAINAQRMETLDALRAERIAALQSFSDQRVAILKETREIMQETLAAVGRLADTQRVATLVELRAKPLVLQHDVERLVMATLDRGFVRVLWLLGISYVVLMVTAYFWWRLVRPNSGKARTVQKREAL